MLENEIPDESEEQQEDEEYNNQLDEEVCAFFNSSISTSPLIGYITTAHMRDATRNGKLRKIIEYLLQIPMMKKLSMIQRIFMVCEKYS